MIMTSIRSTVVMTRVFALPALQAGCVSISPHAFWMCTCEEHEQRRSSGEIPALADFACEGPIPAMAKTVDAVPAQRVATGDTGTESSAGVATGNAGAAPRTGAAIDEAGVEADDAEVEAEAPGRLDQRCGYGILRIMERGT